MLPGYTVHEFADNRAVIRGERRSNTIDPATSPWLYGEMRETDKGGTVIERVGVNREK